MALAGEPGEDAASAGSDRPGHRRWWQRRRHPGDDRCRPVLLRHTQPALVPQLADLVLRRVEEIADHREARAGGGEVAGGDLARPRRRVACHQCRREGHDGSPRPPRAYRRSLVAPAMSRILSNSARLPADPDRCPRSYPARRWLTTAAAETASARPLLRRPPARVRSATCWLRTVAPCCPSTRHGTRLAVRPWSSRPGMRGRTGGRSAGSRSDVQTGALPDAERLPTGRRLRGGAVAERLLLALPALPAEILGLVAELSAG